MSAAPTLAEFLGPHIITLHAHAQVYPDMRDLTRIVVRVDFAWWCICEGSNRHWGTDIRGVAQAALDHERTSA